MTNEQLQARANRAVNDSTDKPWMMGPNIQHQENLKLAQRKEKVARIGAVRTCINLLDQAMEDFADSNSIKNTELRIQTKKSFDSAGVSFQTVHRLMGIASARISTWDNATREHHDGQYDNFPVLTVLSLVRASLVHHHTTSEDTVQHTMETLRGKQLHGFEYDVKGNLDTDEDNKLLKQAKAQAKQEEEDFKRRLKLAEHNKKLEKAKALKAKRDREDELLQWLDEQTA